MVSAVRNFSLICLLLVCFACGGSSSPNSLSFSDPGETPIHGQVVASGLTQPMEYLADPANPDRAYVIQKGGTMRLILNDVLQPGNVVDLSSEILATGECGFLGFAFDPNYAINNYVYLHFDKAGPIRACIVRYTMNASGTQLSDPYPIFSFATENNTSHKGGSINFGKDGYLYIGTGDGASPEDSHNNAQNGASYMGKLLRIDVSKDDYPTDGEKNYGIPFNNPYRASTTVLHEIFGVGFRNPFRWNVDALTGGIFIADVGQDKWEEVNYIPFGASKRNFGWRVYEGPEVFFDNMPRFSNNFSFPFFAAPQPDYRALIGGFVYRGSSLDPVFKGRYFFADATTRKLDSIPVGFNGSEAVQIDDSLIRHHMTTINDSLGAEMVLAPVSVTPDSNGEIMVVDLYGGRVVRLIP